jgi:hypothetical protein
MKTTAIFILSLTLLFTILSNETKAQNPLFLNSVVSNNIDFILDTDPDDFVSLTFIGLDDKEMPSSLTSVLFDVNTFVFEATFASGPSVEIWCHSSFPSQIAAQEYADKLCPRLGKLPNVHRDMLHHVVIHNGDATAFAETQGNFFVLYSDNMDDRISTNDLEETVFHESVHASIQETYENSPLWLNAQAADPACITDYGQASPNIEDMAESALFAYTFLIHPGRLAANIENWLIQNNSNRLAFFHPIYLPGSVGLTEEHVINIPAYPNPTSGTVILILEDVEKDSDLKIYSITGTLLKSIKAKQGQNEIELATLSNGVYLLSLEGYKTIRIIKE